MKCLILAAAFFCSLVSPLFATQTENVGLHAVPAPGPVVIDGSLADWDLSGEVLMCYDMETLLDRYSAHVSFMYDAKNLYVGIRWNDETPMGNIHDPRYQANKAWAGDSVQLRIRSDKIAHVTAWYYAAGAEPAMLIDYGASFDKPFGGGSKKLLRTRGWKLQEGAEMAFRKDDGGKGYVQEIKIPWRLITDGKKYAAGDRLQIGVELFWGEADWPAHRYADNLAEGVSSREFFFTSPKNWGSVVLEPKGSLKLPEPDYMAAFRKAREGTKTQGPVEIAYDLPKDALVTLAIDDKNGQRVRNLTAAQPRKAGKNTEKWDGLDDSGKPVEPGEYAFKIIYHNGIHANYALSFANPGNPTWATPDGRGAFYADHTPPMAAAASGDAVALACPMGEAGTHLIGLNLDGQRLWGLPNRMAFDGGWISLATDGKILWVANEGKESTIYRVNVATGKYAPWKATVKTAEGAEIPLLDLKISDQPGMGAKGRPAANLRSVAWHAGELAACLHRENLVKILDAETGAVKASFPVPEPQSIAHDGKSWLVLSRGTIFRLGAKGGLSAFSTEAFPDAFGLAAGADGTVYLSVQGSDQNVKVFSPGGKLVREIGKRGGRPERGVFIAEAMRNPAGIAVDARNRLWVTERTRNPKRTSVWDAATGALLKDLSGVTSYAGAGSLNPFDSSMGFSDNTVYQIDWATGASKPVYSIGKSQLPDALFSPSVHDLTSRVVRRDGRLYVVTPGSGLAASGVNFTMFDGKEWRPVAYLGVVETQALKGPRAIYKHPFFEGHGGQVYAWTDKNGDGVVQQSELQFFPLELDGKPVRPFGTFWGVLPDDKGTVTYYLRQGIRTIPDVLVQFAVTGTAPGGALEYDVSKPRFIHLEQPLLKPNEGQITGGSHGRIYLNQSPLLAVNSDGKILGHYPSNFVSVHGSHKAMAARPGYLIGPSSFLGVADFGNEKQGGAGEVFYLNGNLGENYLFTSDCLYIQTLFKDTRGAFETPDHAVRGMPMDNMTASGESFGGNFVRAGDGKCYVTLGATDARVMEVTGLDGIRRLSGKFSYTREEYAKAQKLALARAVEAAKPKVYRIARAAAPVEADGKAAEWPELTAKDGKVAEIEESPSRRYGRAQLRYDSENLYVAWAVISLRKEMKNAGQDFRLLFKTGDVVDLMIGPDPQKPDGTGNSRLVLSVMDGKPVAVLNQPKAPGAPKSESFEFASPWRSFTFDRVVELPEVKAAVGRVSNGYLVEAVIPWKALGIKPASGLKLRGDVGVLFGDASGSQTIARHYWSNQNTNLVNDVPGEAELTPKLWGTFELQ